MTVGRMAVEVGWGQRTLTPSSTGTMELASHKIHACQYYMLVLTVCGPYAFEISLSLSLSLSPSLSPFFLGVRIRMGQRSLAMPVHHVSRSCVILRVVMESVSVLMCVSVRTGGVETTAEHHSVPSQSNHSS